ncbi:MAG: nitrate reductase molybdenum cofactor assembly chaperone [Deltaproteobacteria bacterium]|nr:nitrate reductase molybdenum cofactor assembly chaperone [Deltaproteobacteria bacterium]
MTEESRLIIKIAAHLFQYPNEALLSSLRLLAPVIAKLSPGASRDALADFCQIFSSQKLIHWQEEYSRRFDLNPATCLHLTYHKYGDCKDRGTALAQLQQLYRRAGYEKTTSELPDFLPLILEFLSICPSEDGAWLQAEYWPQIEGLAKRLQEAGSVYAGLLAVVADTLKA